MFQKTKFKKGDEVLVLDNLTTKKYVKNVYIEKIDCSWCIYDLEMVVLDDGKVYEADKLTFYSEPIKRLKDTQNSNNGIEHKHSLENIEKFKKVDTSIKTLRDEIFGKPKPVERWNFNFSRMLYGLNYEEPKQKSLVERIEELEAIVLKKNKKAKKTKKAKK